ncbi:Na-Ca exchanger/integrin-beta4 [Stanieria cyanosphaera PCC 7437]|uniref:Na-Ca exchanger/integrin-beta4 n=1 Tax=Stanieria cyanosphaera (strain ATCC 29371 / PCC 7437) TaxID=111780 RepID=K9XQJ4_STAC7|nr:Calx-beta domain-containing protein [Stanieria cyanosphaera]AFZ34326.1 Na-Ca exchanger/integrin-beta4 [Stanieria cyanosphaera PCC 7437]
MGIINPEKPSNLISISNLYRFILDESKNLEINSTLDTADYFLSINRREDNLNTNYNLSFISTADPISTVSVTAQDSEAKEEGTNAGKFRITRDGDTSEAQTVNYVIATGGGQAVNGVDYEKLSGSITIPAEHFYVDLFVTPIDDSVVERTEKVTITLKEVDGDIGTGTTQTATVTIEDN